MPDHKAHLTVIAFDYGLKQIGVAVGQTLSQSTNPVGVVKARNGIPDWEQISTILKDWQPGLLLVGLPLNMDSSESELSSRARKFARRLQGRFGVSVKMVDERLTSAEAKSRSGQKDNFTQKPVDDLAAQIILESWLNQPESAIAP